MKEFIKYVAASIVGTLIVGLFSLILFFLMIGVMASLGESSVSVKKQSILRIQLSGTLQDRAEEENPFKALLGQENSGSNGLDKWVSAIRVAAEDKNIAGIYLDGGSISSDFATLEELRAALVEFKKSKKFIIAYADQYSQSSYYLASVADKVMLNPNGMIDWHGIASQPIFYTGLLEKVGVKMQVFKVGTYKSFVEPYILTKMSDANREQVNSFIGDIWSGMVKAVSASRKLPVDTLNAYADRYITLSEGKVFKNLKLVDELAYIDQVRDELRKRTNKEKVNFISPEDLSTLEKKNSSADGTVAVYYAQGAIVTTPSTGALFGEDSEIVGDKVVRDLDELANDKKVKAVVLRINSGGGSAYASEQMWRAIQLLKKKKPVVISMGGAAASGGYYMSCGANYIFAEPSTITGSIGIFGMIPDASNLLTQKLGLNFDVVKTNEAADFGAIGRSFNSAESAAMQNYVDYGYKLFITRVAEGRTAAGKKMTIDDVDKIGQGRVWTGSQALKNGLVDKLGTIDDAIAHAAKLAKTEDYSVKRYPAQVDWLTNLQKSAKSEDYIERKLRMSLGEYYEPLKFVGTLKQNDYMQARMFFELNLK